MSSPRAESDKSITLTPSTSKEALTENELTENVLKIEDVEADNSKTCCFPIKKSKNNIETAENERKSEDPDEGNKATPLGKTYLERKLLKVPFMNHKYTISFTKTENCKNPNVDNNEIVKTDDSDSEIDLR